MIEGGVRPDASMPPPAPGYHPGPSPQPPFPAAPGSERTRRPTAGGTDGCCARFRAADRRLTPMMEPPAPQAPAPSLVSLPAIVPPPPDDSRAAAGTESSSARCARPATDRSQSAAGFSARAGLGRAARAPARLGGRAHRRLGSSTRSGPAAERQPSGPDQFHRGRPPRGAGRGPGHRTRRAAASRARQAPTSRPSR